MAICFKQVGMISLENTEICDGSLPLLCSRLGDLLGGVEESAPNTHPVAQMPPTLPLDAHSREVVIVALRGPLLHRARRVTLLAHRSSRRLQESRGRVPLSHPGSANVQRGDEAIDVLDY